MNFNIKYEPVGSQHIEEATELIMEAYDREKEAVPSLPENKYYDLFKEGIEDVLSRGSGFAAIDGGKMIGFLVGYEGNGEFFGKYPGVLVPIYGHAICQKYGQRVWQELYRRAAERWVKDGRITHVVSTFAHDQKKLDTLFWLGFGHRCVDAIRNVSSIGNDNPNIEIRKGEEKDLPSIADMHGEHISYYKKSPIFMPTTEVDPLKDIREWFEQDNSHLWIAYIDEKPVGYMKIEPTGDSFISKHPDLMNVTGAYVRENSRGSRVGMLLLNRIQYWLQENDYPLCGVDFESINTLGSNFWTKHFTPYRFSLLRRIDERVI